MTDRGIIFSAAMVRALLAGRKTQTRRLLKPSAKQVREWNPDFNCCPSAELVAGWIQFHHPLGGPYTAIPLRFGIGDRLYARESWRVSPEACEGWHPDDLRGWIDYQAGGSAEMVAPSMELLEKAAFLKGEAIDWDFIPSRYRPAIHMPRWASRMWLAVGDVCVQRLQDISESDAIAEGVIAYEPTLDDPAEFAFMDGGLIWNEARDAYAALWNTIHNAPGTRWEDNPWVAAITFDVNRGNIDAEPHNGL